MSKNFPKQRLAQLDWTDLNVVLANLDAVSYISWVWENEDGEAEVGMRLSDDLGSQEEAPGLYDAEEFYLTFVDGSRAVLDASELCFDMVQTL